MAGTLYLGAPVWACTDWRGSFFPTDAGAADLLKHYAQRLNAVEGNSSFYALPSAQQVLRWRALTPESFHFCFKFPRRITHEMRLRNAAAETVEFLQRLAPLGSRLGPLLLQLPPQFAPAHYPILDAYLAQLSREFDYAVEVRNLSCFAPEAETALDELLLAHGVSRCHFDTSGIHRATEIDDSTLAAMRRKPKMPRRAHAVGSQAMLRIVGQNQLRDVEPELEFWAPVLAQWLARGLDVHCFLHTPDDFYAAELSYALHARVRKHCELPDLPPWYCEHSAQKHRAQAPAQLALF
jgi:uncharacterized protein YecE (DUF72 family)